MRRWLWRRLTSPKNRAVLFLATNELEQAINEIVELVRNFHVQEPPWRKRRPCSKHRVGSVGNVLQAVVHVNEVEAGRVRAQERHGVGYRDLDTCGGQQLSCCVGVVEP